MPIQRIREPFEGSFSSNEENTPYTSKELTSLYRIWLNTPERSERLTIPANVTNDMIVLLSAKGILRKDNNEYFLTFEGKKIINKIILTTEKSSFEKKGIDVIDAIKLFASNPKRSTNLALSKKSFNLKQYKQG
jgi:hypothetical protein